MDRSLAYKAGSTSDGTTSHSTTLGKKSGQVAVYRYARNNIIQRGFTLLETLVALAVLAIALGAILRTAGIETQHTEELRMRLLADWVAQNRLALHSANGDWLPTGFQNGEDTQAGIRFIWKEEISATPNPAFRRIEIGIYAPEDDKYVLRKLTGYLVQQRRK